MSTDLHPITTRILASRKYRDLYPKTVERIVTDCLRRYGPKNAEERARNLLHQTWGAYYPTRPDWIKLYSKVEAAVQGGEPPEVLVRELLHLHSSTTERLPALRRRLRPAAPELQRGERGESALPDFYRKIFEITGTPSSILDHGCGLNPLTLPFMHLPPDTRYTAYDIDLAEVDFLNQTLELFGWNHGALVLPGDILADEFPPVDVVFLLKLLPPLEHEERGVSLKILRQQQAKFLVVSFPAASLSGKNKGMPNFYAQQFQELVAGEGWPIKRLDFPSELVFVVKK